MSQKNKTFWKSILASDDNASSKRLVTLIIALHFIVASFATLFIAFYVVFYLPKGRVEVSLLDMLKQIMEYDFYIILSGLGFITAENMGQIFLEKAKNKSELLATAIQNQPSKVVVTPPVVAPQDAKVTPATVTPITGDDLIINTPSDNDVEVTISKTNKPE
jgi:hypothetical protein